MSSSPIIIQVTRGLKVESFHQAFAVVVDEDGKTIFAAGDENYVTCFRSSLKPFQASAAIAEGATEETATEEPEASEEKQQEDPKA